MEALQDELERSRKENETLKVMVEVMSGKLSALRSNVQEIGSNSPLSGVSPYELYGLNKRPRIEIPMSKPSQILVKTDPKDKSLVSVDHVCAWIKCLCAYIFIYQYLSGGKCEYFRM